MFRDIWSICQLRAGPQSMPYSKGLLATLLLLTLLVNVLQLTSSLALDAAINQTGVMILSTVMFTYLILSIRNVANRFVQTLISLLAVSLLINLIMVPMVIMAPFIFHQDVAESIRFIGTFLYLVILFFINLWLVLISAHIYHHALNISFFSGVLVTLALFGLNMLILSKFFGLQ